MMWNLHFMKFPSGKWAFFFSIRLVCLVVSIFGYKSFTFDSIDSNKKIEKKMEKNEMLDTSAYSGGIVLSMER